VSPVGLSGQEIGRTAPLVTNTRCSRTT